MAEVRGLNTWRDELASLVEDTGIRYVADPIMVPTPSFEAAAAATEHSYDKSEPLESLKDQMKGFAMAWGEILMELGRGCRDIVQRSFLTEDSYVVRKLQKLCARGSAKLSYECNYQRWQLGKKVRIHPSSATHILLPDGRHMAYLEQGVPVDRARFSMISPHFFPSSRLAV